MCHNIVQLEVHRWLVKNPVGKIGNFIMCDIADWLPTSNPSPLRIISYRVRGQVGDAGLLPAPPVALRAGEDGPDRIIHAKAEIVVA